MEKCHTSPPRPPLRHGTERRPWARVPFQNCSPCKFRCPISYTFNSAIERSGPLRFFRFSWRSRVLCLEQPIHSRRSSVTSALSFSPYITRVAITGRTDNWLVTIIYISTFFLHIPFKYIFSLRHINLADSLTGGRNYWLSILSPVSWSASFHLGAVVFRKPRVVLGVRSTRVSCKPSSEDIADQHFPLT